MGRVYLTLLALFALAAVGGAIKQGLGQPRWLYQAIAGAVGLLVVAGVGLLLIRSARSHAAAAPVSQDEADRTPEPRALWDREDASDDAG